MAAELIVEAGDGEVREVYDLDVFRGGLGDGGDDLKLVDGRAER